MASLKMVFLASLAAVNVLADGGTLVLRQQAGPLTISVFSSPNPLRVGRADLSVMVQRSSDQSSIMDATVKMHLSHSTPGEVSEVFAPATHAKATNKLLYAAQVNLPAPGSWKMTAEIASRSGNAEIAGEIDVLAPLPPLLKYWPYFALLPLVVLLFVFNRWLRRRRVTNRPARP